MKRFLFACAGVGLAIGGGYLMYRAWRNYYQGENNDADDLSDDAVSKTKSFFLCAHKIFEGTLALHAQSFSIKGTSRISCMSCVHVPLEV